MKKLALLLSLCLLLTGCTAPKVPNETTVPPTQAPTMEAPTTEAPTTEPPVTEAPATEPPTTAAPEITIDIFLPNENADGLNSTTVQLPELEADLILAALVEHQVLREDISLNFCEIITGEDGKTELKLDFNEAFSAQLNSYGTSGEMMMISSVANTFLRAFDADRVFFTADGQIMESGHVVYDFPISFRE